MMNRLTAAAFAALAVASVRASDDAIVRETADLQARIDRAGAAGGGRVEVAPGVHVVGTVWMRSNVELHLPKGAVLKGSVRASDYNRDDAFPGNFSCAPEEWSGGHLVCGVEIENASITGEGVIDGNGPAFFGACDEDGRWPYYKYGLKLHPVDRHWYRPGPMVAFFRSRGLRVEGVTLRHTPGWTIHFRCCDGVKLEGVTVDADRTIANSDGFHFDCTRNVVIRRCTALTGDDAICLRASCAEHAETNLCENVLIEDCDISSCCHAIRLGVGTGTIRNVDVRNCRVHEAGPAFGLTPAYFAAKKHVFIHDIRFTDCQVRESYCGVSLSAAKTGKAMVRDVTFANCSFEALHGSMITANDVFHPENLVFTNCTYRQIARLKVRHSGREWSKMDGARAEPFLNRVDPAAKDHVKTVDCRVLDGFGEPGDRGVLLLSFDDRHFEEWERAVPVFEKYGARATFFCRGRFEYADVKAMERLFEHGHTIGMHGVRHRDAPSAMDKMGEEAFWKEEIAPQRDLLTWSCLPFRAYAYPNCSHDDRTDRFLLSRGITRVCAAAKDATPYDPRGEKQHLRKPLETNDLVFEPAANLKNYRVVRTILVGESYHTDIEEIVRCLRRAAERREVLSITSHGIVPDGKGIDMKTEWLERILREARDLGLAVVGYDDLPDKQ